MHNKTKFAIPRAIHIQVSAETQKTRFLNKSVTEKDKTIINILTKNRKGCVKRNTNPPKTNFLPNPSKIKVIIKGTAMYKIKLLLSEFSSINFFHMAEKPAKRFFHLVFIFFSIFKLLSYHFTIKMSRICERSE